MNQRPDPLLLAGCFFFFNDTATTEIYTLSLHDALPISLPKRTGKEHLERAERFPDLVRRSEEHTSELQSHSDLGCRLLLEKKKKDNHRMFCSKTTINITDLQSPHALL